MAFAVGGSFVVGTEAGDWLSLTGEQLAPIASIGRASAAVRDPAGALTVACWEPKLERYEDGAWSSIALASPALALAATAKGLVIADAGGGLSLMTGRVPVQELVAPEPVVELAPGGDGLVALLASGKLMTTAWPTGEATLVAIDTHAIGRAHAMFGALVAGAKACGVLDRRRLVAVATPLPDRIAGAAAFSGRGRFLVHTDDGEACIVDDRLNRVAGLAIGDVAGCASGDGDKVLAWTTAGALEVIASDGAHRRIADGDVVLAAPEVGRIGVIAVRRGNKVTRGLVAWT
jgi:hypothetical protein